MLSDTLALSSNVGCVVFTVVILSSTDAVSTNLTDGDSNSTSPARTVSSNVLTNEEFVVMISSTIAVSGIGLIKVQLTKSLVTANSCCLSQFPHCGTGGTSQGTLT